MMRNIYLIVWFFTILLTACQNKEKGGIDVLEIDGLRMNINSAGIGYDVLEDNTLDSSGSLTYIVALSATNNGKVAISFNEESFSLFNSNGEKMPSKSEIGGATGTINLNAITTTIGPGDTKEIMLVFTVKEHGVYRFQIVSPVSGSRNWVDLPTS